MFWLNACLVIFFCLLRCLTLFLFRFLPIPLLSHVSLPLFPSLHQDGFVKPPSQPHSIASFSIRKHSNQFCFWTASTAVHTFQQLEIRKNHALHVQESPCRFSRALSFNGGYTIFSRSQGPPSVRGQCSLPFPQGLPIASSRINGNDEDLAWDKNLLTMPGQMYGDGIKQLLGYMYVHV